MTQQRNWKEGKRKKWKTTIYLEVVGLLLNNDSFCRWNDRLVDTIDHVNRHRRIVVLSCPCRLMSWALCKRKKEKTQTKHLISFRSILYLYGYIMGAIASSCANKSRSINWFLSLFKKILESFFVTYRFDIEVHTLLEDMHSQTSHSKIRPWVAYIRIKDRTIFSLYTIMMYGSKNTHTVYTHNKHDSGRRAVTSITLERDMQGIEAAL